MYILSQFLKILNTVKDITEEIISEKNHPSSGSEYFKNRWQWRSHRQDTKTQQARKKSFRPRSSKNVQSPHSCASQPCFIILLPKETLQDSFPTLCPDKSLNPQLLYTTVNVLRCFRWPRTITTSKGCHPKNQFFPRGQYSPFWQGVMCGIRHSEKMGAATSSKFDWNNQSTWDALI